MLITSKLGMLISSFCRSLLSLGRASLDKLPQLTYRYADVDSVMSPLTLQVRFKLASSYSGRVLKHVYEDGQELDSPEEKYPHSFVHHKIPPDHLEVGQLLEFEDNQEDQQGGLILPVRLLPTDYHNTWICRKVGTFWLVLISSKACFRVKTNPKSNLRNKLQISPHVFSCMWMYGYLM